MSSSRRLLALLIVAAAGLTACGRYAPAPTAAAGYRLFLEEGYNGAQQVTVLDSAGAVERRLPIGTPAPDFRGPSRAPAYSAGRTGSIDIRW